MKAPLTQSIHDQAASLRPRALTLELTKGCNLRCGYCYYAAREEAYDPRSSMSREVAEQSVELLLQDGPAGQPVHLHLFGGEPLLNLPLMRHVVLYGERRAQAVGRELTFEVTTNGTRFSDDVIGFLNEHALHVGVSFDGPPEVQDVARPALHGSSYQQALPGLRRFLDSRRGTPLAAKTHCSVVITRRELNLVKIVDHLEELGFQKILLTPATDLSGGNGLRVEDLPVIKAAYTDLAARYEARRALGETCPTTWFKTLMGRVTSGVRKTKFCDGGRDYLGVTADGRAWLCYRFYEDERGAMGDVHEGIDRQVTEEILSKPLESRPACSTCWARYFCGGGCHHENLISTGGLGDPNPVTCEILRHSMDLTLDMWARLDRRGEVPERKALVDTTEGTPMTQDPIAFTPSDRLRQMPGCHERHTDGERVVYQPATHELVVLNPTAALIFDRCDGSCTLEDLLAVLARQFDAPKDVLRQDLLNTVQTLARKGLLGLVPAPVTQG